MKLQVYRTDSSSYQTSQFLSKEQEVLEGIPGITYIKSLGQTMKDIPFVLITNTHTQVPHIPKTILDRTKLLIHPNSGYDNLNPEFVDNCHFPIIKGNSIRSHAVTEYVLSCLFQELTPVPNHRHWSGHRTWDRKLLRDQKTLIIGHGHIGKTLSQSLKPLVSNLKVFDPHSHQIGITQDFNIDMFKDVNILIIAAELNDSSFHMIDKQALSKLATDNLIINPARGGIIKESDLFDYLKQNKLSKCYLDVFEEEPFSPGFQVELSNLNKTSHIAGVFENLNDDIIQFEFKVISDFIEKTSNNNSQLFYNEYSHRILNNHNSVV